MKSLLERLEELHQLSITQLQDILVGIDDSNPELVRSLSPRTIIDLILKYEYRAELGYKLQVK